MIDYVLNDNKEVKELAKSLGFSNIIKVEVIKAKSVTELKRRIKDKEIVVVEGNNDEINNAVASNKKVDILLSPEKNRGKDFLYQRNSGLNHILCRKMGENKVSYGINLEEIIKLKGKYRGWLLGKIMQNVRLCRRYKVNIIIGSFASDKYGLRSKNDIKALGRVLGVNKLWNSEILKREEDIRVVA